MVDVILVMTVNPGYGGQTFLPEVLPKIRQVRAMITASGRGIDLEVDGGIDATTAPLVAAAGANVLIAGSAVFNRQRTVQKSIEALQTSVAKEKAG